MVTMIALKVIALSCITALTISAIPMQIAADAIVSTLRRRQVNATDSSSELDPSETVASYIASLQTEVIAPNSELDSREWQQSSPYVESIFSVNLTGNVVETYNISLDGCTTLGTVVGVYEFSDGTTSSGVTLLDIASDIDGTIARSGSTARANRALGGYVIGNAQAVASAGNAYLNAHVCDWQSLGSSDTEILHDDLRRLLQFELVDWQILLAGSILGGFIVGGLRAGLQYGNMTMSQYLALSVVNAVVIFATAMIYIVRFQGGLQPQEAIGYGAALAWQRRVILAAGVAASAASPTLDCIQVADLDNAMEDIGLFDDPNLRVQNFEELDGTVQAQCSA